MTAALAQVPWPTLLAGGLVLALLSFVALIIRAIVTGQLVPRAVLQDEKDRGDKWEAAWRESEKRVDEFDGRLTALAEAAALNEQLLRSLLERARRR